jgi:hypothetical protein
MKPKPKAEPKNEKKGNLKPREMKEHEEAKVGSLVSAELF